MSLESALICAWRLGDSEAVPVSADILSRTLPAGDLWIHLNRDEPGLDGWLSRVVGVPDHIVVALLQEDTRPRCEILSEGILLNLRGINLNEGDDPEDMLSLRVWVAPDLLITLRKRPLASVRAMRERLKGGDRPDSLSGILVGLIFGLGERAAQRVGDLDERLGALEDAALGSRPASLEPVSAVRASVVRLRRFLRPQQAALNALLSAEGGKLGQPDRAFLRNAVDNNQRLVEFLDELLERSSILRDEIGNDLSRRIERNMYTFTLLAGVFLPLGFITGLLGVNVAGIPGAQAKDAFWVLCAVLVGLLVVEVVVLQRLRLLKT